MKILLDESLPRKLRNDFGNEHDPTDGDGDGGKGGGNNDTKGFGPNKIGTPDKPANLPDLPITGVRIPPNSNAGSSGAAGNGETNATGNLFGGSGTYNIMQAARLEIGRNDANRKQADMAGQAAMLWMGVGAAPLAAISGVETAPVWLPMVVNGLTFKAETSIAAGSADFVGQMIANGGDLSKWNIVNTAGATFLGNPLYASIPGGIFNISFNSVIDERGKTIFNSPLQAQTRKSIGFNALGAIMGNKAENLYLNNLRLGGISNMSIRAFGKFAGQMTGAVPAAVIDEKTKPSEK